MKFVRLDGPPIVCVCAGCNREGIGGTDAYASAASGIICNPEEWYRDADSERVYCAPCGVRMAEVDSTRAVNQFYSDTSGEEIIPEL